MDEEDGRYRDRPRTNSLASAVELFSVHPCKVSKVEKYGAFLEFADGLRDERGRPQSGLLHVSQMAETRVENPEKVVENEGKISLTIRNVRQSDGTDLDPGNTKIMERAPGGGDSGGGSGRRFKPIELGAVVNTVCSRCGGKGHTKYECFAGVDKVVLKDGLDPAANAARYDFVDSSDDDEAYFKAFQKPEFVKETGDKEMTVKKAFEILRKEEKRKKKRKERKEKKEKKKYEEHRKHKKYSSSSSSSSSQSYSYSPSSSRSSSSSYSSTSSRSRSSSPSIKKRL